MPAKELIRLVQRSSPKRQGQKVFRRKNSNQTTQNNTGSQPKLNASASNSSAGVGGARFTAVGLGSLAAVGGGYYYYTQTSSMVTDVVAKSNPPAGGGTAIKKEVVREVAAKKTVSPDVAVPPPSGCRQTSTEAAQSAEKAKAFKTAATVKEIANAAADALAGAEEQVLKAAEKRANALKALQSAIASRDPAVMESVLVAANAAGLADTPEKLLAESYTRPLNVVREGLRVAEIQELLAMVPSRLNGLGPEGADAASVEEMTRDQLDSCYSQFAQYHAASGGALDTNTNLAPSSTDMSREELASKIVNLSNSLERDRDEAKERLEQALRTRLEEAGTASMTELHDALAFINEDRNRVLKENIKQYENELESQNCQAVAQARVTAQAEVAASMEAVMDQVKETAHEVLAEQRAHRLSVIVAECAGLASLEDVLAQVAAELQQSETHTCLALAALNCEDAFLTGRSAGTELNDLRRAAVKADRFVAGVLAQLPQECVDLCHRASPIPTEPALSEQLNDQIDKLVTAAFIPPNSGLFGELVARAFAILYVKTAGATPCDGNSSDVAGNLRILEEARASKGSNSSADLSHAVSFLGKYLTGECKTRSMYWLDDARNALIIWQALRVAKTQSQCLNAGSPVFN